ncbi:MAG: hypothetical protein JW836_15370 [Deltaproteobacteria bacterium]|nr:hypothetical protein [Deltaproteobacteria bacterium]
MLRRTLQCMAGLLVTSAAVLWLTGCATTGSASKEAGIAPNIVYKVTDSAQITKVAYYFKGYEGKTRLHMELSIKNISSETKRYRVNIFLPEGPAAGGLYPRAVKADAKGIEAGKEQTQAFPMYFNELPTGFTIVVKEML